MNPPPGRREGQAEGGRRGRTGGAEKPPIQRGGCGGLIFRGASPDGSGCGTIVRHIARDAETGEERRDTRRGGSEVKLTALQCCLRIVDCLSTGCRSSSHRLRAGAKVTARSVSARSDCRNLIILPVRAVATDTGLQEACHGGLPGMQVP